MEVKVSKVKKRDGRIVKFDEERLKRAIRLAFKGAGKHNEKAVNKVYESVIKLINETVGDKDYIEVEKIQDIIEVTLMKQGYFDVAKQFILYREQKRKEREEKAKILNKDPNKLTDIEKRFSLNAIRLLASRYLIKDAETGKIIESVDDMFKRVAVLGAIPEILYDEKVYDKNGGHFDVWEKSKDRIRELRSEWEKDKKKFRNKYHILRGFNLNEYHFERLLYAYENLAREGKMKVTIDELLGMLENNPEQFENARYYVRKFFELMSNQVIMPNTPALVNAGRELGLLSACFVVHSADSLASIFDTAKEIALISKAGGGIGLDFSVFRPAHNSVPLSSTGNPSSGVLSWLDLYNKVLDVVKQSSIRRGAGMGVLWYWHVELEDFIHAKEKNRGDNVIANFNLSVGTDEKFWDAVLNDGKIDVIANKQVVDDSTGKVVEEIRKKVGERRAVDVLDEVSRLAWAKGDPGILYFDNHNKYNIRRSIFGDIRATNPCVTGDMRIPTPYGLIPIAELYEEAKKNGITARAEDESKFSEDGDRIGYMTRVLVPVEGSRENGFTYRPLSAIVWKIGTKNTVRIVTEEGYEIGVSSMAKVMREDGPFVHAKDLKPGDKLIYPRASVIEGYVGSVLGNIPDDVNSVPEIIFRANIEAIKDYLTKLFNKLGNIGSETITLSADNTKFLKDVQVLLNLFDVKSRIEESTLVINGVDSEIFRKRVLAQMNRITMSEDNTVTVREIVPTGKQVVYDITVLGEKHIYTPNIAIIKSNCGEEGLYPYESCNLSSINLEKFVKYDDEGNAYFDWDEFAEVVRVNARLLDNFIDVNKFPLKKIEEKTKAGRNIGAGLMGLANALFRLGIPYNCKKGFELMSKFAEYLTFYSYRESIELAKSRGTFSYYEKTDYPKGKLPIAGFYNRKLWTLPWDELVKEIKQYGVRNVDVTTSPPTGSVSMIADTSNGIEPIFALAYKKVVTVGTFYYSNPVLEEELKKRGLYDDRILEKIVDNFGSVQGLKEVPKSLQRVFVTSMDIHWLDHIVAQVVLQRWITNSISKTINMPNKATVEDVKLAYVIAHELGAKGLTVYRDGSLDLQVYQTEKRSYKPYNQEPSKYALNILRELLNEEPQLMRFIRDSKLAKYFDDGQDESDGKQSAPVLTFSLSHEKHEVHKHSVHEEGVSAPAGGSAGSLSKEEIEKLLGVEYCPVCYEERGELVRLIHEGGCETCPVCGWSACTVS